MKSIFEVIEIISASRIRVKNAVGREATLNTDKVLSVGDFILVVNGVVIGKTKAQVHPVYEV